MQTPPPDISTEARVQLAKSLFNRVWELMEKQGRTRAEDEAMVQAAFASRFHWGEAGVEGKPVNFARGEWLISRVYAVLGRAEPGLHHALRCLEWCEEHALSAFDFGYAWEAVARAAGVVGDEQGKGEALEKAREYCGRVEEGEDRGFLEGDLEGLVAG